MNKKNLYFLIIIIIIALTLRLYHLDDKTYGTDENHSIENSKRIFEQGLKSVDDYGNPPLFFYLLALSFYTKDI